MEMSVLEMPAAFEGYLEYYSLRPKGFVAPKNMRTLALNEFYISPVGRLCSLNKAAQLDTPQLAEAFRQFLLPSFRKRHGEHAQLLLVECSIISPQLNDYRRLKLHSCLVRSVLGITG